MTESYRELLPTPDFEIRTAGFSERLPRRSGAEERQRDGEPCPKQVRL